METRDTMKLTEDKDDFFDNFYQIFNGFCDYDGGEFGLRIYTKTKEEEEELKQQILSNQEKAEKWDKINTINTFMCEWKVWEELYQENKHLISDNQGLKYERVDLMSSNKQLNDDMLKRSTRFRLTHEKLEKIQEFVKTMPMYNTTKELKEILET